MQRKIVTILLVLSFLLLASNILVNLLTKEEKVPAKKEERRAVIDSLFMKSLTDFALDSNWVQKKFINTKNYDSLNYVYHITVPGDLPVTVVLQYLIKQYESYYVNLISEERVINRYSVLDIYSNDILKLQAHLKVNNKAERDHSKFAFIIEGYDKLDKEEQEQILNSKYELVLLIKPSQESLNLAADVIENNKRYCIEINDEIADDNYKLE